MDTQNLTLATYVMDNRLATYNNLAGLVIMIYEIADTAELEVQLVWISPWSLMNILHIVIRYFATAFLVINVYAFDKMNLSNKFCGKFNLFQTWGPGAFIPVLNMVLLLRIFALYGRNRFMGVFLIVLWIVETACLFVFMGEAFSSPQMLVNPWPGILPGCFPLKAASYAMIIRSGGTTAAFQLFYLGITMIALRRGSYRMNTNPMLRVFFRDSVIYCLSTLGTYMFNALLVKLVPPGSLQNVALTWVMVVLPIVVGRLILNLKHVAQKPSPSLVLTSVTDSNPVLFTSIIPTN